MNIQLLLDGNIMELDKSVSFPINKRFSNLDNPTDIFVDYTKSISIPATAHNNKVLGNAYRLDKQYGAGDVTLGLDMNPLKRIPVKLLYNGEIFFDGYAKYVSSTQTNGVVYYNINLFGAVADVFQSLLSVVLDSNKLSDEQRAELDGGAKYILDDGMNSYPVIDMESVKSCWEYDGDPLSGGNHYTDIIGFAPAYRGLYDDFESNSIVGLETVSNSDGTPKSVEDVLKEEWKVNIKAKDSTLTDEQIQQRVDSIDLKAIFGDGINEHSIRQFRAYEQKPYVYFCRLMRMYQNKCKELTGYDLNLDSQWFNANNPYWTRLCYMFDYLSGRGVNEDLTTPFSGYNSGVYTSQLSRTVTYSNFSNEVLQSGKISLEPFDILLENKRAAETGGMTADPLWSGRNDIEDSVVMLNDTSYVTIDITFSNSHSDSRVYKYYAAKNKNSVTAPSGYSEFISVNSSTEIDKTAKILTGYSSIKIPAISIPSFNTEGLKMTVKVSLYGETDKILLYRHRVPIKGSTRYNYFSPTSQNADFKVILPNTNFYSNWRLNTTVALKNLYTKEEPLFNVILQYTKMFGLVWKPDYINKTITITTKQSYFKDYEILDWTDKFDGKKSCVIEPVTFNAKYISFDYKDVDGFRYTGYKNKHSVNYGGKKIRTNYNFNNNTTEMIENMHPSSISTKSYIPLHDLIEWDTYTKLEPVKSPINFIDSEDAEQSHSISLNNWYFRGKNYYAYNDRYFISDASTLEKEDGQYYWIDNSYGGFTTPKCTKRLNYLPRFSPVFDTTDEYTQGGRVVGCLMNCPNEDFTADKSISSAVNNYVYDICWRDFINERYNSNNKKVTAYFTLSYNDFNQFSFNKLVKFNNQLFVVNNIFDFDPNARESTKVELIQVSDIDNYTNASKLFPIINADKQVWRARNGTGNMTLYIKAYPRPTSYEIIQDEGNSGVLNIDELTSEMIGNTVGYFLYYYDSTNYKGKFRLIGPDYTYEIPIEIN